MLIFNMYAGRLEIVTVFVLATTGWWRFPRRLTREDRLRVAEAPKRKRDG
jgi:Trk-type K+ transport system membrane component